MKPAVFLDLDFEAARDRANEEGRILLVNVVASQNAECQEMDRTTWRDPEVEKRIAEGAIAIQIDVDADAFIAKMLVVRSTPAIVAQDRGGHVDHVERSLTASELLAWFDSIALGKTYKERRQREVAKKPSDTFRRLQLAGALHKEGSLDAATAEYVWLWKHMLEHEPKMAGIKHSTFVTTLKRLAGAHPPAREAFSALRTPSPPDLDGDGPDAIAFADWFALNTILGDDAKTLAWFDAHRDRALSAAWLAPTLALHLEPVFVAADRWADVARLHPNAVDELVARVTLHSKMREEMKLVAAAAPPGFGAGAFSITELAAAEGLREMAYKLVRALKAAGREDEAKQITDAASAADPSAEMAAALAGRYTAPTPEELLARGKRS